MSASVTRACALTLSAWAFASPGVQAGILDDCMPRSECRRVSGAELDRLRGGFTFTKGGARLQVTFGIAQAVVINDELVAVTQLRLPDLGTTLASFSPKSVDLSALAAALKSINVTVPAGQAAGGSTGVQAVQQAPDTTARAANTVATPPVPDAAAMHASAAAAASARGTPSQAAPASQIQVNGAPLVPGVPVVHAPSADALRGLIVQNGPGNVALPSAADLRAGLMGIVVQNSLSDQTIRALTVLNVAVSVTDALSTARIQESVRQSIASSLR